MRVDNPKLKKCGGNHINNMNNINMEKKNNINMKNIRRKKNGGDIIIEPLINGFKDLNDGDEYVYIGKHNKVLLLGSEKAKETNIAKVLWGYNIKNRDQVIDKFALSVYDDYKKYIYDYEMVNKFIQIMKSIPNV
jgi:hypothetical protein